MGKLAVMAGNLPERVYRLSPGVRVAVVFLKRLRHAFFGLCVGFVLAAIAGIMELPDIILLSFLVLALTCGFIGIMLEIAEMFILSDRDEQ